MPSILVDAFRIETMQCPIKITNSASNTDTLAVLLSTLHHDDVIV